MIWKAMQLTKKQQAYIRVLSVKAQCLNKLLTDTVPRYTGL